MRQHTTLVVFSLSLGVSACFVGCGGDDKHGSDLDCGDTGIEIDGGCVFDSGTGGGTTGGTGGGGTGGGGSGGVTGGTGGGGTGGGGTGGGGTGGGGTGGGGTGGVSSGDAAMDAADATPDGP